MDNATLEKFSNIISATCSDESYASAATAWMQSKYAKMLDSVAVVQKVIDDPAVTLTDDEGNAVIICEDGAYVTVASLKESLLNDEESVSDMNGTQHDIDRVLETYNSSVNEAKLMVEAITASKDAENTEGVASVYLNKVKGVLDYDGSKQDIASAYLDIVTNKSATPKEKIMTILNSQFAGSNLETNEEGTNYLALLNNSDAANASGRSALAQMGASIAKWAGQIDVSSVPKAIATGCKAIVNGLGKVGSWMKDNALPGMMKVGRKVSDWINVQHCDIQTQSGGNGCVDNAYVLAELKPNQAEPIITRSEGYAHPTDMKIAEFHNSIPMNQTFVTEIPGAEISYLKTGENPSEYTARVAIRYKMLDYKAILKWCESQGSITLADLFTTAGRMYATESSLGELDQSYDDYYFSCLLFGKAISHYYLQCIMTGKNLNAYIENGDWAAITLLCSYSTGLNDLASVNEVNTGAGVFLDPTNEQFFSVAARIAGMEGYGPYKVIGSNSLGVLFSGIAKYCAFVKSANDLNATSFIPYTYKNCLPRGSYVIMNDNNVLNQYWLRVGAVIATAVAVSTPFVLGSYTKRLRNKAVIACLDAANKQSAVQKKLSKGLPISDDEMNAMYKATKKALRLNKLSGGFGTITVGLSTWANTAGIPDALSGLSKNDDIKRLIIG